jgi:hypothetical protein
MIRTVDRDSLDRPVRAEGEDRTLRMDGLVRPELERPVPGESSREARERRERNRLAREWWDDVWNDRCEVCGMVRFHVSHEMDPEHSAEGPEYHADFAHHAFQGVVR